METGRIQVMREGWHEEWEWGLVGKKGKKEGSGFATGGGEAVERKRRPRNQPRSLEVDKAQGG